MERFPVMSRHGKRRERCAIALLRFVEGDEVGGGVAVGVVKRSERQHIAPDTGHILCVRTHPAVHTGWHNTMPRYSASLPPALLYINLSLTLRGIVSSSFIPSHLCAETRFSISE